MGDKTQLAFLETLFSRTKGIKSIYDAATSGFTTITSMLQALSGGVALAAVQGKPDLTQDAYTTEFDYLRSIYTNVLTAQNGGTRPPFRRVITPGDGTPWQTTDPTAPTFTSVGSAALNPPLVLTANQFVPPFSTPRPYFDFGTRIGAMETAESYAFGFAKEDQPIIQLNACFQLPRLVANAQAPAHAGFGLATAPPTTAGWSGIWIEPDTSAFSGAWLRPWPIIIWVSDGTTVNQFRIGDIGVPSGDAAPGGITISWNRASIAVSLYRGQHGMPTSGTLNPQWWLFPINQWEWLFPWPFLEQFILGFWGSQLLFPGAVSLTVPPPVPAKAIVSWPSILVSEVDVEELQYYPRIPSNNPLVPQPILIGGNPPGGSTQTQPTLFELLTLESIQARITGIVISDAILLLYTSQAYNNFNRVQLLLQQEVSLGMPQASSRLITFSNSFDLKTYQTDYYASTNGTITSTIETWITNEKAYIDAWRAVNPVVNSINPANLLVESPPARVGN